jgi:hypothetical protein
MLISKNITLKEIPKVVLYWYNYGMCPHIIQNEDGIELDEILNANGCYLNEARLLNKYRKMLESDILKIVLVYFDLLHNFTNYATNLRVDDGHNTKVLKFLRKQIKQLNINPCVQ